MPVYEYECEKHGIFEEEHSIKIKLEFCPKCKEEGNESQPVKRLISLGGKGVVELTGYELQNKVKEDAQKLKKEAYGSAEKYANLIGEDRYHSIQTQMDRRPRRK